MKAIAPLASWELVIFWPYTPNKALARWHMVNRLAILMRENFVAEKTLAVSLKKNLTLLLAPPHRSEYPYCCRIGFATSKAFGKGSHALRFDVFRYGWIFVSVSDGAREGAMRLHGGAKGSGAPKGERNGAYRTGFYVAEAVAFRREARETLNAARSMLADLPG